MSTGTNFFNLANKSATGEDLIKEGVDYKVFKDGNGVEYKIVNFENPEYCPREGIIELIPMRLTSRHENRLGIRNYTDRVTGIIYGIPQGINPTTKQIEFQKINLVDAETFDLSDSNEAMKWAVIRRCFAIEGSPNLRGKPKYKVKDVERAAVVYLKDMPQKMKAMQVAMALTGDNLMDMARNIGVPPENNSINTLQMHVVKYADEHHQAFLDIWDSPTREQLSIFRKAIAVGVLKDEGVNGWCYNGNPIGMNEGIAVQYLSDNHQICKAIEILTKKIGDDSVTSMKKFEPVMPMDDKDAKNALLQAELDKTKEMLAKLSGENILKGAIQETGERDVYLAEAKRLNIKGAHMVKDLAVLRDKVLEKNPEFSAEIPAE